MSFTDPEYYIGPDYLDPADVDAYEQAQADGDAERRDILHDIRQEQQDREEQ